MLLQQLHKQGVIQGAVAGEGFLHLAVSVHVQVLAVGKYNVVAHQTESFAHAFVLIVGEFLVPQDVAGVDNPGQMGGFHLVIQPSPIPGCADDVAVGRLHGHDHTPFFRFLQQLLHRAAGQLPGGLLRIFLRDMAGLRIHEGGAEVAGHADMLLEPVNAVAAGFLVGIHHIDVTAQNRNLHTVLVELLGHCVGEPGAQLAQAGIHAGQSLGQRQLDIFEAVLRHKPRQGIQGLLPHTVR
ncbi:hypothetical protein D3C75_674610 [compost metagenome]